MKFKLTQEEYDNLNDTAKAEYEKKGDNYVLKVEGFEDDATPELRRAKEREKQRAIDAEKKAKELQDKLDEIQGNNNRRNNDIDSIEKSWKEKLTAAETSGNERVTKLQRVLESSLVDSVAQSLATKLCGQSAALIMPHLKSRIKADFEVDPPVTRILDASGNPTALTVADLEKEFRAKPEFAVIIVGSNASGSGARGANNGGGAAKKISEMSDAERVALYRENPQAFQERVEAEKAARK